MTKSKNENLSPGDKKAVPASKKMAPKQNSESGPVSEAKSPIGAAEENTTDDVSSRAQKKKNRQKTTAQASTKSATLATILALIALIVGIYSAVSIYQMPVDAMANTQLALETDMAELKSELQFFKDLLAVRDLEVKNAVDDLTKVQQVNTQALDKKLSQSLVDIRRTIGTSGQDWLLAEVEYLVRLGNQRVIMEADPQGAIALFEAADGIIRDAEGIIAFDLRQALANDIAVLNAVDTVDVEGVFVKLGALVPQIGELKQKSLQFKPAALATPLPADMDIVDATLFRFGQMFDRFFNLIDYRSGDEVIVPILPPEAEQYLRQNIVMKLQFAQLGMLKSNQQVFSQSLLESIQWIQRYFDPHDVRTKSVLASLASLQAVNVKQSLPDVTGSLSAVRQLLVKFHQQAARDDEGELKK
ncbi:MAG: uroporphyrinogen-III C-methyltransferase [Pseudomonadales bacterium]|nr:uroporphyrinogen-III C-methyltransferase [Pseudomonadales bacterium]